jgi:ethanolamine utilization protein EutN
MRIAQVIGTVTLNRVHPTLSGARLKLVVPLSLDDLRTGREPRAEELVVYDDFGAGLGSRLLLSEGPEAAQAFYPDQKPVDAYNAGLLDRVDIP